MSKKKHKSHLSPQKRSSLQLTRLNSTLSNKSVNVPEVLQELGVESYSDYLFKVFLPSRASVKFPGLSAQQKSSLMKYLIVGVEVWQLITSDGSVDSESHKWPSLATLKHSAQLDTILDKYHEVLKWEEGRRLFLAHIAQSMASSLEKETTIDPPPPVKWVEGTEDQEIANKYSEWVAKERKLDEFLRHSLQLYFGQLILVNEEQDPNALPSQSLISATAGLIVQGTPGSQAPDELDENGNQLYPWPLYTNTQVVDELMSIFKFILISRYRNKVGTTPYHISEGIDFEPYPEHTLQITSLFYHPIIPEELKTLFQPIADDHGIKLDFVYPETMEEMEKFSQEYIMPSQEAMDAATFMNDVLGSHTSPEVANRVMRVLLESNTLNDETLKALTELGISDEDKVVGIANIVLDDDYGLFDKISPGLSDKIKELVSPILDETVFEWKPSVDNPLAAQSGSTVDTVE